MEQAKRLSEDMMVERIKVMNFMISSMLHVLQCVIGQSVSSVSFLWYGWVRFLLDSVMPKDEMKILLT